MKLIKFFQQEQIAKKVQDVLAKTPLEIKPRRELPRIGKFKDINTTPLIDFNQPTTNDNETTNDTNQQPTMEPVEPIRTVTKTVEPHMPEPSVSIHAEEPKLNILGFEVVDKQSPSKSPQNLDQTWDLKQTNSLELLTPSPLGFTPFDSRSIDELMTPDEFGAEHLPPGLSNINYDIDLSDFSGDNSIAEDTPKKEPKDPFSPDGLKKTVPFDPFAPQTSRDYAILDSFDEFSFIDKNKETDPFEVVHRGQDPFSPVEMKVDLENDPFSPPKKSTSILDDSDSPTSACLLPSPLQPQSSGKPA